MTEEYPQHYKDLIDAIDRLAEAEKREDLPELGIQATSLLCRLWVEEHMNDIKMKERNTAAKNRRLEQENERIRRANEELHKQSVELRKQISELRSQGQSANSDT